MATNYGNSIDVARDPRRQPPVHLEDVSRQIRQHDHGNASSTLLHTNSPSRETSTDDTPIPPTSGQCNLNTPSRASPGTSVSPGLRSSAAEAVALMRKVPVRTVPSPRKKKISDNKPQKKPVAWQPKLTTDEKNQDTEQHELPIPQRSRSLHMDTQLKDSELEVQCVRGEGNVLVRHLLDGNFQDAQLPPSKAQIPDQKFPINYCWNKVHKVSRRSMKWIADLDGFEIPLDGKEKIRILAEAVSSIFYNIECRKFYLNPKSKTSTNKHFEELLLKVGGDGSTPFKLRSIFEQRFGAVKVTRCEKGFFVDKERIFQQHNMFSVPPRSTSQPEARYNNSSDGLEEGVVDDLNSLGAPAATKRPAFQGPKSLLENTMPQPGHHEAELVSSVSEQPPDAPQESIKLVEKKVDKSMNLDAKKGKRKLTPLPIRSDVASASEQPNVQPSAYEQSASTDSVSQKSESGSQIVQAVVMRQAIPPIDKVALAPDSGPRDRDQQGIGPASRVMSWPIGMYFRSGERLRPNDLVIRVRDDTTMADGKNKLDKHDIFDGPFSITEISEPIKTTNPSIDTDPDGSAHEGPTAKLDEDQIVAMREKQVKLNFPKGSVADPWTKLGRLRPVYYVYPEVPDDLEARQWYYWPKSNNNERKIMNTEEIGGEADEVLNSRGVCCVQKGFYSKVQYVATGGLGVDGAYEMEKLRDKVIERLPHTDFPDEIMDDPNIIRYFKEEGGVVEKSEVLVVKYLVHWAGWPSEDDSYERAQDNIPQSFIDEYEAVAGTYAEIPEPARKRRKSGAKRYIKMP